ncbi:MAG: DUF4345 domain-containing protein [Bacteroidota bacterium]|nr:DUF4345 domain-containing protein [Bacteroidota bacterium]
MNAPKIIKISSQIYVGFCILSLLYVSLLSLYSPQATMDLVATTLPNTDAISSIRGIYGGVGLVINFALIYLLWNDLNKALVLLCMFWAAYAISRVITSFVEGPLGSFGSQWLVIELTFSIIAFIFWTLIHKFQLQPVRNK